MAADKAEQAVNVEQWQAINERDGHAFQFFHHIGQQVVVDIHLFLGDVALQMIDPREQRVFIYGTVQDIIVISQSSFDAAEPRIQEIYLKAECPFLRIIIKFVQDRVVIDAFEKGLRTQSS